MTPTEPIQDVEIRPEGAGFSVYVDGRKHIDSESYTVAHGLADELRTPGGLDPTSELYEVAQSIRQAKAERAAFVATWRLR
jgi:hypothetical protein